MKQQEIIDALLVAGFTQPYENQPHNLEYKGYPVRISKDDTLPRIFLKLISMGETLKCWEIKNILQVV